MTRFILWKVRNVSEWWVLQLTLRVMTLREEFMMYRLALQAEQPNTMKLLSWNVRGLGRSQTINRLRNKLRAINPRILFLMETKLNSKNMEMSDWIKRRFIPRRERSYSHYHVDVGIHDNEMEKFGYLRAFMEILMNVIDRGLRSCLVNWVMTNWFIGL
ncbi:hypothetical protein EPI10_017165 [Gossypium australe]|uniref:Reverse transcriptase n=1 Tax=Gossypium australe TaxID=47621 RepID=A0A5B6VR65_9ROSI|nr:hypothetical protein EPI10_017165 [Gossypium australe]